MFGELFSHIVVFDSYHIYLDMEQGFSQPQMIIEFAWEMNNLAWRALQSQNGGDIFAPTKWSSMFGSVIMSVKT